MDHLSPSTINVRLSAIRKLVGEARRNGMIGRKEADNLTDIPNVGQKGTRLGNWLTREQAKELLAVPDRSTLKGKRDYVIIALLVGCALRRRELATLNIEDIQLREGRWVIIDLRGKGGRIRAVAVPIWVRQGINVWMNSNTATTAAARQRTKRWIFIDPRICVPANRGPREYIKPEQGSLCNYTHIRLEKCHHSL
jgi:integrase